MPIRPENKARYPKDWPAISRRIRFDRARGRCEDCGAENYQSHPVTGSKVVLTVAHLDHQPEKCADENLRAWCQRCHNAYDAAERRRGIRARAHANAAAGDPIELGPQNRELACLSNVVQLRAGLAFVLPPPVATLLQRQVVDEPAHSRELPEQAFLFGRGSEIVAEAAKDRHPPDLTACTTKDNRGVVR